jgi:toxin ParE1/3/4
MYRLIVRQRVIDQSRKQYVWYEEKRIGLGEDFLLSVEACLNYIQRSPFAFQKKYNDVRVGLPDKFPFGIFYIVDKDRIIVLALFYLGQNPKKFNLT